MVTREETAAATRTKLLLAAGALLDLGGPEAVTLRGVGARAGLSRSAPYRHFADKEELLTTVATAAWTSAGDVLQRLSDDPGSTPGHALRQALLSLLAIGREQPHVYRLMFATPSADPTAGVRAAGRAQDLFITIVSRVVGTAQARPYAGLLLTSAHGITGLEVSGHLALDKWDAGAEDLVDLLIELLPSPPSS